MSRCDVITVIIPCYNHEQYIEECLHSVDTQIYPRVQVVIVDDGSTDNSWSLIRDYPWRRHTDVRMIRTRNRGAHAAINYGLTLARGRYVNILNSDDYFSDNRLARLAEIAEGRDLFFAYARVTYVDAASRNIEKAWPFAQKLAATQAGIADHAAPGFANLLTNTAISTGNMFFSRSVIEQIGYFRPYRYCHDWDFLLRTMSCVEPTYLDEVHYFYRLHPNNSFLALQRAAEFECPELMRRYLRAAHTNRFINREAPSPANWPVYFEHFLKKNNYQSYLQQWSGIDGIYYDGGNDLILAPEDVVEDNRPKPVGADATTSYGGLAHEGYGRA